ncbi:lipopolysaccharide biosynthesis protein [Hymenobacter radiodurans]|uniref:lipopolysaccharide biosynthesis protein n=1 Tax=Hymenobacter radiodurans TaxID=2496028 RepID=UPI0010586237|nr:lipopolysaccharide biosynthesis protein [Hymenobacter radiodurans]
MLKRVFQNIVTRLATAGGSFGIVWLTARYLGAAGRGAISLFVTDCALLLLFVGLVGGVSLMYLAPRRNVWNLLIPAYMWASMVCTIGAVGIWVWRTVSFSYVGHLWGVCLLQAFFLINAGLLLGRRQERTYNSLLLLATGLQGGLLLLAFTLGHWHAVEAYYYAAYIAQGIPFLLSLVLLYHLADRWQMSRRLRASARELARHSRAAHLSNILSFINFRLSYYFVAYYADTHSVGVLSVGVALTEAVWVIARSASQSQYVDLIYAADKRSQVAPTLRGVRLTLLSTTAIVLGLCLLPASALAAVFGADFGEARPVILLLAPGVVAMAVSIILNSYFAGLGRYQVNTAAAIGGLFVTVPACWLLIPQWGIEGAATAATLSYLFSTAYLLRAFRVANGLPLSDLLPGKAELHYLIQLLRLQKSKVEPPREVAVK